MIQSKTFRDGLMLLCAFEARICGNMVPRRQKTRYTETSVNVLNDIIHLRDIRQSVGEYLRYDPSVIYFVGGGAKIWGTDSLLDIDNYLPFRSPFLLSAQMELRVTELSTTTQIPVMSLIPTPQQIILPSHRKRHQKLLCLLT